MTKHAARSGKVKNKVVASVAVLAAGAALLSGGIYATWTSGGTADQSVQAVDLSSGFKESGGADNVFQDIENAFPGDYWTRYATLENNGSVDQEFAVRVDSTTGGLTADDDGLEAAVSTCAVPFISGGCEVGDQTLVSPAVLDEDGNVLEPAAYEPNADDDAVVVVENDFITDGGRSGVPVSVEEDGALFFKISFKLADGASQDFEAATDTAFVEVRSLTAERAGTDRTNS